MYLTKEEEKMLDGERGPAIQRAMDFPVTEFFIFLIILYNFLTYSALIFDFF